MSINKLLAEVLPRVDSLCEMPHDLPRLLAVELMFRDIDAELEYCGWSRGEEIGDDHKKILVYHECSGKERKFKTLDALKRGLRRIRADFEREHPPRKGEETEVIEIRWIK